tara:strand:+ start:45268 stop:45963 length:696 start_codon:yes stop_codon:yes gene_type:complete
VRNYNLLNSKILKDHQGFTLVEILVALTLVVGIFTLIPTSSSDEQHGNLESTIYDFERATRFAVNEAILRNSIIRISIDLNAEPQTYSIEFSSTGTLVLPEYEEDKSLSLREQELQDKKLKDLDGQFNKIDEFSEEPKVIPRFVRITGLGTHQREKIQTEGKVYIYFYPTGEKDAAILFFTTEQEFASLAIPAFENRFSREFSIYSESDTFNLESTIETDMKESFDKWLKS